MPSNLSPKKWSPHMSALKRRTRKSSADPGTILGSLEMLEIDTDSEDEIFLKTLNNSNGSINNSRNKNKTNRSLSPKRRGVRKGKRTTKKPLSRSPELKRLSSQDDIPPAIQAKLAIISDPATPMRERIQLELEMKRNPEEEKYVTEFKNSFDRKKYLAAVEKREKEEEEQLKKNLLEEEARACREKEGRAKAKLAELEEEIAKQEREDKMRQDIAWHRQQAIAKDSEELRKNAERMLVRVTERGAIAEMEEKERQTRKEEYLVTNGKDLTHVEKVLVEAIMDQKDTVN